MSSKATCIQCTIEGIRTLDPGGDRSDVWYTPPDRLDTTSYVTKFKCIDNLKDTCWAPALRRSRRKTRYSHQTHDGGLV